VIWRESGDRVRIDSSQRLRMSTISIGGAERPLAVADAGWIAAAFEAHAHVSEPPCVRVMIRAGNVDMNLQTPNCAAGTGGGGRPPSREEAEISRLWNMEGLSSTRFTATQVAAFVECVGHLLR
jgi:hypothetical protein